MPESACANPLLLEWVKEWYDTARERNSKGVTTYKHAYDSLKACPITFQHPTSLQALKGFGPKLCERLAERLRKYCQENGLPMPAHPGFRKRQIIPAHEDNGDDAGLSRPAKKPRKAKAYVPAYRSGAYAILLVLASQSEDVRVGMTKTEIIEEGQPHCDASFTTPSDPRGFYCAWDSVKTLLQKELVYERGRPAKRYALTDEGWEVARQVRQTAAARGDGIPFQPVDRAPNPEHVDGGGRTLGEAPGYSAPQPMLAVGGVVPSVNRPDYHDVVADGNTGAGSSTLPTFNPIVLEPGSFSVRLVLDVREIRSTMDRDYMQDQLAKKGVKPIVRNLELGDALWVAKCNDPARLARYGAEGDEVMLDWIAERKRLDDLIMSIKDGRFHEQKFRLRRSGIKNVIYLVEEIAMDATHFQKYEEAVQSAIASTQVVNGYFLKKTYQMDDTIRYLARMTVMLEKLYTSKPLHVIPTGTITAQNYLPLLTHLRETQPSLSYHISYPAFTSLASKSDLMTLRDLYLKMLMCTKRLTGDRAVEIQKRWKTPYELVKAFERCGEGEEGTQRKINLVSDTLSHLVGNKKIDKHLSQTIAEVWGDVPP